MEKWGSFCPSPTPHETAPFFYGTGRGGGEEVALRLRQARGEADPTGLCEGRDGPGHLEPIGKSW